MCADNGGRYTQSHFVRLPAATAMPAPPPFLEVIDDDMARVLAGKSEVERLRIGFRMWTTARSILRAAVMADHHEWAADRVNREVAVRISHGVVAGVVE